MSERTLVLVEDPELLDSVLRLAAAAGCAVHRSPDAADARRHWSRAPFVLVDEPSAVRCLRAGLPRRAELVLVGFGRASMEALECAVALGADQAVELPEAEAHLMSRLGAATERGTAPERTGRVLAVVGGRGGAGASVLAAAVAVGAARSGERTLLVDCDPLGGGLDLVLGAEEVTGLRWPELRISDGRVAAAALHAALPAPAVSRAAELGVLSCARESVGPSAAAVTAVLEAGRQAGETVVCDLPRYPTDPALAALELADRVLLVVPADVRSCAAAGRVSAVLAEQTRELGLVVRGPSPGGLTPADVAEALDLPLVAAMAPDKGLARALEQGLPPGRRRGPLATAAQEILAASTPTVTALGRAS
ncbi:septum site-determining protein Ssd [Pseudonocardia xishanensis]|uniref:Septum site-determining protein Ssd n=1 Tax=Pseudonocardia xishanensis TaxID=630995 RepID=A0ABP8RNW0_9PSEU